MAYSEWELWIDRGDTFTDVVARHPECALSTRRLLSDNPERYRDAAMLSAYGIGLANIRALREVKVEFEAAHAARFGFTWRLTEPERRPAR